MCPQNFLRRFALLLFLLGFLVQGCAVFQGEQYVEPEVQAITIASFNIRIFSDKSRDDEEIDYESDDIVEVDKEYVDDILRYPKENKIKTKKKVKFNGKKIQSKKKKK